MREELILPHRIHAVWCQEKLKVEVVGMKLSIVVVVLIGYLFVLVGANSFAAEPTKVLIAHGAISNNVEPLWIAKEQGIFRKYGIEAELVFIIAGRAMQAMLAGQVPVGLVGSNACREREHRGRRFCHDPRFSKQFGLSVHRPAEHQDRGRA